MTDSTDDVDWYDGPEEVTNESYLIDVIRRIYERHLIPLANQEGQGLLRMDLNDLADALEPFGEYLHG